ncbi:MULTISPECIES: hypothetical protein [unclassified Paenibacillus]|uniref:hypothetical protein n=1 Tax=unclassified Paenibacillus TaxID=185978 RepID=UPI00278195AC|nr:MULTISPECIES: hypothetical protein [unclassified Paenibacillus]MDQ0899317.1 hypothetical protein [Paenibacillus sp. V4I7]MDQ0914695.1 hypothetical protein [Paenibacillus sp. V4I5]
MICAVNEDGKLIAVGYLRQGIADDYDVMEILMQVNENAFDRISEIRMVLYPALIDICEAIRNPVKKTKLVGWDEFDGDQEFYVEQGFSPNQTYYFAKRSHDKSIPEVNIPIGVDVRHHPIQRVTYTTVEINIFKALYIEASICWNG